MIKTIVVSPKKSPSFVTVEKNPLDKSTQAYGDSFLVDDFYDAVEENHIQVVQYLLKKHPKLAQCKFRINKKEGVIQPLHFAIRNKDIFMFRLLLKYQVNINDIYEGKTLLHYLAPDLYQLNEIDSVYVHMARDLIKRGVDIGFPDDFGDSFFHWKDLNPALPDYNHMNLIRSSLAKLKIERGLEEEAGIKNRREFLSLVYLALELNNLEMLVSVFNVIECDEFKNRFDTENIINDEFFQSETSACPDASILHKAVETNNVDILNFILSKNPDINTDKWHHHNSALHIAANQVLNLEMVVLLVENGANIHVKNKEQNKSPVELARKNMLKFDFMKKELSAEELNYIQIFSYLSSKCQYATYSRVGSDLPSPMFSPKKLDKRLQLKRDEPLKKA